MMTGTREEVHASQQRMGATWHLRMLVDLDKQQAEITAFYRHDGTSHSGLTYVLEETGDRTVVAATIGQRARGHGSDRIVEGTERRFDVVNPKHVFSYGAPA